MEGWWVASYAALWVLVGVLAVVVLALARQIGTLHLRLSPQGALELDDEGPALGAVMPPLPAADVDGREVIIGGSADAMSVLLFATPGCRLCRDVLPSLPALARGHRVRAFLITDATNAETTRAYGSVRGDASLIASIDLAQTYSVPGTPYVVVLDEAGRVVAKGTVNNLEQFEGLVETAEHRISTDSVPEHV